MAHAAQVCVHVLSNLTLSIVNIDLQRSVWSYLNYLCSSMYVVCVVVVVVVVIRVTIVNENERNDEN